MVVVRLLMIMHRMPFYSVGHPTSVEFVSFGPNFGRAFFWPGGAGARWDLNVDGGAVFGGGKMGVQRIEPRPPSTALPIPTTPHIYSLPYNLTWSSPILRWKKKRQFYHSLGVYTLDFPFAYALCPSVKKCFKVYLNVWRSTLFYKMMKSGCIHHMRLCCAL